MLIAFVFARGTYRGRRPICSGRFIRVRFSGDGVAKATVVASLAERGGFGVPLAPRDVHPSFHHLMRISISSSAALGGRDLHTSKLIPPKQMPRQWSRTCCMAVTSSL